MSKIPMMVSFKGSNHYKIVFDHLTLSCNAFNSVSLGKKWHKTPISQPSSVLLGTCHAMHFLEHVR